MIIEQLLDDLDDMIDHSKGLGGKRIIDAVKLRVLVDEIRLNMPQVIEEARHITSDKNEIIDDAKRSADSIVRAAEDKAKAMVSQEEITKMSQERAGEILALAQKRSKEMRRASQEFVEDLMRRADEGLTSHLTELRRTRAELKQQGSAATRPADKE